MSHRHTTLLRLSAFSLVTFVVGVWQSKYSKTEIVGENGSGYELGLSISPFVFLGLVFCGLTVAWYRLSRS